MEKNIEVEFIKNSLETNYTYREKFLKRLKDNLAQYNLECDQDTLEELLIEATTNYKYNNSKYFYLSTFIYIKDKLIERNENYTKNALFSEEEMKIIKKLLEKQNKYYLSDLEIANEMNVPLDKVVEISKKLDDCISNDYSSVKKILGQIKSTVNLRKQQLKKRFEHKYLNDVDLEIIGLFTGQIDDICIDIVELAEQFKISPRAMLKRIESIYKKLDDKENYQILLEKYPDIEEILKIRNGIILLYKELLENAEKAKTNKTQNNNVSVSIPKDKRLVRSIEFLKLLLQPVDGKYLFTKQIAEKLNLKIDTVYMKKSTLLSKIKEDETYKAKIKKYYPNIEDDILKYEMSHKREKKQYKTSKKQERISKKQERIQNDIKFLKDVYQAKDNNYTSVRIICERHNVNIKYFYAKTARLLQKLEQDEQYKNAVLKEYPNIYDDVEKKIAFRKQEQDQIKKNCEKKRKLKEANSRIKNNITFLKKIYQPNPDDGNYYTYEEIAEQMEIRLNSVYLKLSRLLSKLEEDKDYEKIILDEYPTLYDDMKTKKENTALSDIEKKMIELIYTDTTRKLKNKKTYAKELHVSDNMFRAMEHRIPIKLKNNPRINNSYPDFNVQKEILDYHRNHDIISLSEEELKNIQKNVEKYVDSKEKTDSYKSFIKGLKQLEKSCYGSYINNCTLEQKTMLALRFGIFNDISYGSNDVSDMFGIDKDTISLMTKECIESKKEYVKTKK